MTLASIRKQYGVPAYRGARVEYTGDGSPRLGTITGATRSACYIRVLLDGDQYLLTMHPTWKLRYIGGKKVAR